MLVLDRKKNVEKYLLFGKKFIDNFIINDLINGDKNLGVEFSYKMESFIRLIYYCLNYFLIGKTYGEKTMNIEIISNPTNNSSSVLNKFKILLPYIFKIILKHLSINNAWFNFIFHGLELIDLIKFLENNDANKSQQYDSILNYLFGIKYTLSNNSINSNFEILSSNWTNVVIEGISKIISEIYFLKDLIIPNKLVRLIKGQDDIVCKICGMFPSNLIYFDCGHYFCYYCYYYHDKINDDKNNNILGEKNLMKKSEGVYKHYCIFCK